MDTCKIWSPLMLRTARSLSPSPVRSSGSIECIGYCRLCSHSSLVLSDGGAQLSNLYARIFCKDENGNTINSPLCMKEREKGREGGKDG